MQGVCSLQPPQGDQAAHHHRGEDGHPSGQIQPRAPPAVIPVTKRTYAEAAATPFLDGATHIYVQRGGVGPPLADNYGGPYLVLEKGTKVFRLLVGGREEVFTRDCLKPPVGQAPPRRGQPPQQLE